MKKVIGLLASLLVGCGASGTTPGAEPACEADTFRNCECEAPATGTQSCAADGSAWGACECGGLTIPDAGVNDAAVVCGDQICDETETCLACPTDCGQCPKCDYAPTCSGAFSIPTQPMTLDGFNNNDQTAYVSGVGDPSPGAETCTDPNLKIRVSQIKIHKKGKVGGLEMFCMVQADDGQSSELVLTPALSGLSNDNAIIPITPGSGTFWGQEVGKVKLSPFNITITYACFEVTKNGALTAALGAIAAAGGAGASVPGNPYGWAFGLGGAAAGAAAAAVAASDGNELRINVQQTIAKESFLDLTNGRTWVIRQNGDNGLLSGGKWDWELQVEAWGCSTPKPGPAQ